MWTRPRMSTVLCQRQRTRIPAAPIQLSIGLWSPPTTVTSRVSHFQRAGNESNSSIGLTSLGAQAPFSARAQLDRLPHLLCQREDARNSCLSRHRRDSAIAEGKFLPV